MHTKHINNISTFNMIQNNNISILPQTDTQMIFLLTRHWLFESSQLLTNKLIIYIFKSFVNKIMNYVLLGLQNVSTQKLVQKQDSCLKSHLPPECKRCISAVFHSAAFAGYRQKPPTNKLSVHKSQLFDFQNEFSHLSFFCVFPSCHKCLQNTPMPL